MNLVEMSRLVDEYSTARDARLALAKDVEKLEEIEKEFKRQIIEEMQASKVHIAGGKTHTVKLKITPKPTAEDWSKVYAFIKEHDAFDILFRRLNEKAIEERQEQGEVIPGLDWFPVASLSISKGASK